MNYLFLVVLAFAGGTSHAQQAVDAGARAPAVEYRSAFEPYRPFAGEALRDWRKANEEVGGAGGHAGHKPGQGQGAQTSKPRPGEPQSSVGPAEKGGHAAGHRGHGAHK